MELVMSLTDHGMRLRELACYKLASHWALTTLSQGDHRILTRVVGPGSLNRDQKSAIREFLGKELMYEVLKDAQVVLEYLGNNDFHSHGAGDVSDSPSLPPA